jgi:hypothetical protein
MNETTDSEVYRIRVAALHREIDDNLHDDGPEPDWKAWVASFTDFPDSVHFRCVTLLAHNQELAASEGTGT